MKVEVSGESKKSFMQKLRGKLLYALRLTDRPIVKLYNGYGNKTHCFLYGHVLSFGPLPRKNFRNNFLINALALLRLFMVKPRAGETLQFIWEGKIYETVSGDDGFFKFEWQPSQMLNAGFHNVEVSLVMGENSAVIASGKSLLIIPHYNQFAFISDIDDTFLISHSSNLRKRLFILLTKNARSRKSFEGVINHYQLLSLGGAPENTTNPFFYVSSSEWNLYDYIRDFSINQKMPEGVYLLNQLKKFKQVFKTGQNNHATKFMRIARILIAYPEQKFILLGDDSQEDPFIYATVTEDFKGQIFCIYIRKTGKVPKPLVEKKLAEMEENGVPCCYFTHSAEAVIHSKSIGLINTI